MNYKSIFKVASFIFLVSCAVRSDAAGAPDDKELHNMTLFQAVQRVRAIVREELGAASDETRKTIHAVKEPLPFTGCGRTKQGIFFRGEGRLCTPWGEVEITSGIGKSSVFLAFHQKLCERIKTSFSAIVPSGYSDSAFVLMPGADLDVLHDKEFPSGYRFWSGRRPDDWDKVLEVPKDKLEQYVGQEVLVVWPHVGEFGTLYKIHEIDGCALPDPELLDRKDYDYREYDHLVVAWKSLQERYDASQQGAVADSR